MRTAALLVLILSVSDGAALAQDAVEGRNLAHAVCARCHAVERDMDNSPFLSAPTFEEIANVPGMTATALGVILRNPHREMPDLVLEDDDRRNVTAYIMTLRNRD